VVSHVTCLIILKGRSISLSAFPKNTTNNLPASHYSVAERKAGIQSKSLVKLCELVSQLFLLTYWLIKAYGFLFSLFICNVKALIAHLKSCLLDSFCWESNYCVVHWCSLAWATAKGV